jgi:hypothetical protein
MSEAAVNYFEAKGFQIGFDWRDVWQDEPPAPSPSPRQ